MKKAIFITLAQMILSGLGWSQASFRPLGLGSTNEASEARAVAIAGSVIAGTYYVNGVRRACIWNSTGGPYALGPVESDARGITPDGTIVVGFTGDGGNRRAFRWTSATGLLELGSAAPNRTSMAVAVASDGTIVGEADFLEGTSGFRYRLGAGFERLAPPGGTGESSANATSTNASVVAGFFASSGPQNPCRWIHNTLLPIDGFSAFVEQGQATGLSSTGNVVVGWVRLTGTHDIAFRFIEPNLLTDLGDLPGGDRLARAFAISADGRLVVGHSVSGNGFEAFLWSAETGMVSLNDYLSSNGAAIPQGWRIENAWAISPDGRVVVGDGVNSSGKREGYAAVIGASLTGRILFEDLGRYALAPSPILFEFRDPGASAPFLTRNVILGANDSFELRGLPTRVFDLSIKPTHWLRRTSRLDTSTQNVEGLMLSLSNGDSDQDNEVAIGDFSIISTAFNASPGDPNWIASGDLNGDDTVDIADFSILSRNYGLVGDE